MTTHFEPTYREDAAAAALSGPARSTGLKLVADLVALTKPRITAMVVVTMLGGAWLAAHHIGPSTPSPSLAHLAAAVLGTAIVVGSANALNMYLERDSDGLMARTKNRPLPTGRLHPGVALAFGLVLGAIALPALLLVNTITGALAAAALVSYVAIYTPLKRKTPASLLIGAVPGAIPPLLGWTAVTGRVEWPGVLLFAILFIWQIPHFLAIATFRRDDYTRAGLKVLPAVRGDRVTRLHIVAYLGALVSASILLVSTGVGGTFYLASAIVLGAVFFAHGAWGLRASSGVRWARGLFAVSIVYLVLLFAALSLSPVGTAEASATASKISVPLPAFTLTDQRDTPFGLAQMKGRVWIANFVFTHCPTVCPKLTKRMVTLQDRTRADADAIHLLTISVDPENDTPDVLAAYGKQYGADPARWTFLTGPLSSIEGAVMNGFKIAMGKQAPAPGSGLVTIFHGEKLVLVDRDGNIRGYYDADDQGTERLLRDAARLAKQR